MDVPLRLVSESLQSVGEKDVTEARQCSTNIWVSCVSVNTHMVDSSQAHQYVLVLVKKLDTSNLHNAYVSGMKEDLHLYGNQ